MKSRTARAVVIGGGIMGCSILYHLAKEGWSDCILVEKAELTSGSTWHAVGAITHAVANPAIARMNGYGIELYQTLERETGQAVSWHGCGSLRMAYTKDEIDFLNYMLSVGRGLGHPMDIVGPERIQQLHPFYRLDGVIAALHTPADGHVDPSGAAFALAKGARQRGATVLRRNRVTGLSLRKGGEWTVTTEQGEIICETVINAAGAHARQIGKWVGLDLPIVAMTHHYVVTETVPELRNRTGELPLVRDDHEVSAYFRQEQQSGLIGIYEAPAPEPVWIGGAPWDSENELFPPNYDAIVPSLELAVRRIPIFAERGIKTVVHGAITHPPDGLMLLGPAPGLRNFWCACGVPVGIAWGPGAGKYLAQQIVHGAADISLRAFDPRRFGHWCSYDYVVAKAKEDFVVRHEVPFPGRDRPAGRPIRTSPLYRTLLESGAVSEQMAGWERPLWFARQGVDRRHYESFRHSPAFGMIAAEVRAVREDVGVMDLTAFAKLEVQGRDSASFLDRMLANRLTAAPGRLTLAHLLNRKGTIEAELLCARTDADRFFLTVAALDEYRVLDWLNHHRHNREDLSIVNVSEALGCLVIAGPRSRSLLAKLTNEPLDNETFPWFSHRHIDLGGIRVRALRATLVGELGWELYAPIQRLHDLYHMIWDAGQAFNVENFGSAALNAMRVEKAIKGTRELGSDVTLAEAGMMRFAKLDGRQFVGSEMLRMNIPTPLRTQSVYLAVDSGGADCHGGESILMDGRTVGVTTSGAYGHSVRQSLAFGYIDPKFAAPGGKLEVLVLGQRCAARALREAAHDPHNLRPRDVHA